MSVTSLSHLTYSVSRETQAADSTMALTPSVVLTGDCELQEVSANEALRWSREGMTVNAKAYINGTPAIVQEDRITIDGREYVVQAVKIQRRSKRFTVLMLEYKS